MGVTLTSPRPSHGSLNWDSTLEADLAGLAAGINAAASADGVDFNAIGTSGIYLGGSATNAPGNSSQSFFVWANRFNSTNQAQIAINQTTAEVWTRKEQAGTWSTWRKVVDSSADTGWVTSGAGLSAASGWTLGASKYRNLNGVISLGATMTRTGAAITANTLGVTAATPILNLGALAPGSQANGNFTGGPNGNTPVNAYASASGNNIIIIGTAPSQSIATGAVVELLGTYLL